jgi:hypothetical protein
MSGTRVSADTAAATLKKALAQRGAAATTPDNQDAFTPPPSSVVRAAAGSDVLTVGTGMEFSTLDAALNASRNGDTILVKSGTYVNDFCVVNTNVTVLAMGGMVNEVATVEPPNGKGLIVSNANLTIRGFSFTGGSDGSPDGNVAGIRYQAGNLDVSYCDFHTMEDGLLATPNVTGTGTVTISHSEFYDCGTGDGYTHDIYVGPVAKFSLTDSYVHNAIVGHEVKSRAAVTIITDNVIADNQTGTASYDIDVPNAGRAFIEGNVIEKGPDASNVYAIHYGGETQYAWAENALVIKDNTILNDLGPQAVAVLNQSADNGLHVTAQFIDNSVYGFSPGNLIEGAGTITELTTLATEPTYSTASPWAGVPNVSVAPGPQTLDLVNFGNSVNGGSALLILNDSVGNNTIDGGSGGLQLTNSGGWDSITTAANATDAITVGGRNNTVNSAGNDTIIDSGQYDEVNASGKATVTGSNFIEYNFSGNDMVTVSGGGTLQVLSTGQVNAVIGANGVFGTKDAGGVVTVAGIGASAMQATLSGGLANFSSANGDQLDITGGQTAIAATLGGGTYDITGSGGNDDFTTGYGSTTLALGNGADTVTFGAGTATVTEGTGAETYVFNAGAAGSVTISGFKAGVDSLSMIGFGSNAVSAGAVDNGSTMLTLTNGSVIDLQNVVLPAYAGGDGGSGGGSDTVSGAVTLTSGGHTVTGGDALLCITDLAGGNSIAGGSGGLSTSPVCSDVIGTASGSTNQVALAGFDTLSGAGANQITVTGAYNDVNEAASAAVTLGLFGNTVQGGAGLLSVTDTFGGNTLTGGAGGLSADVTGSSDSITTAQGASDTVTASGYSTLTLAGNDQVSLSGNYNVVTALGDDVIRAKSGWSTYVLDGHDTLRGAGAGVITIGAQAEATLMSTGAGGSAISKLAGGVLALQQSMPDGGGTSSVTVSGGAATAASSGGEYAGISVTTQGAGDSIVAGSGQVSVSSAGADTIWAGSGSLSVTASGALQLFGGSGQVSLTAGAAGVSISAGAGNITLTGGLGNDSFTGGTGSALLWLGNGADRVTFGAGSETIHAGASDIFTAVAGGAGSDTIYGFSGNDQLEFSGFSGNPVAGESLSGGNATVTLTNGAAITLMNMTQLPQFG